MLPLVRNGQDLAIAAQPPSYVRIERTWNSGDTLSLLLPMTIGVRTWTKNQNAVSVDYGPLTFSLKIGEKWSRFLGTDTWPGWEVFPTTTWNYGLVLDEKAPASSLELMRRRGLLVRRHAYGRVPASWRLLCKDGQVWKPVEDASAWETRPNRFNRTTFHPVRTRGLRLEVELQPGFSGGILQWKIVE